MSEREQSSVRVDQSPVRCPYCHEDVQVSEADWVACAGCLARHHGECWGEAGKCGACGAGDSLARTTAAPATAPAPPPPEPDTLGRLVPWTAETPRTITFERTLEGEVDAEIDEVVVTEVRKRLGTLGRFERLGRTMTWTTVGMGPHPTQGNAGRLVTVTVASRDGKTTLDVTEDVWPHAIGARIIGVVFGILGPLMALAGTIEATRLPALGAAVALAVLAAVLSLARLAYVHPYRKRRPELAALTDLLERELRARVRRRDPKAQ